MKKKYTYALATIVLLGITVIPIINQRLDQSLIYNSANPKSLTADKLLEKQKLHKIERRKTGYAKPDKPDKYLEYIHRLKTGGDESKNYPFNYALKELKSAQLKSASLKSANVKLDWKERGPGNVGGRTRGFIADPDDANGNTWYTGPVGGGVWKTTDAGQTWGCITPDWANLSVSCLAMAMSDHSVIYAGTGEGFGNLDAIAGNGIFKSIDNFGMPK